MPTGGAATLESASGGLLEGQWLPSDNRETAIDAAPTTKLMLWARTPFAWFRRNGSDVIDTFIAKNRAYPCGPPPSGKPACLDFDDLARGRLPAKFTTGAVPGAATGIVKVVAFGTNLNDLLLSLAAADDAGVEPSITLRFMVPVEWLQIHYRADKATKVFATARLKGSVVLSRAMPPEKNAVDLTGPLDELFIAGRGALLESICVRPGWICLTLNDKSIPPNSTGRQQVDGVIIETMGKMETVKGKGLVVYPPGPRPAATVIPADSAGHVHPKHEILPGAPSDRVRRLLGSRAKAPLSPVPKVEMRGVRNETPTYLPGIGAALVVPPGRPKPIPSPRVPNPRDWRWAKSTPFLERILQSSRLSELLVADGGTNKPVASVAFIFPHPVTRLHVALAGKATVVGFRGAEEIVRKEGGDEFSIATSPDYVDRLLVFAPTEVRVVHVCYDDGALGWQLAAQDGWQASLAHSIEWMYREDPILAPGDYRLEVVTETRITGSSPGTTWQKAGGNFKVGQPPGAPRSTTNAETNAELRDRYPYGGPLTELRTYVERTMPSAGQRPFYRSYDVGVTFNAPYVSRMFLAAGKQLSLVVLDSNDRVRRSGAGTVWGHGADLAMANEIEEWIGAVNAGNGSDCPTINVEQVALRSEEVYLGAGELLAANELHAAEIRASGSSNGLYRFEFVTSRFANFKHHMALLDGRCRARSATRSGVYDSQKRVAIRDAIIRIGFYTGDYRAARNAASTGSPTREQLEAFEAAKATLEEYVEAYERARTDAFDAIWDGYFAGPPSATLPANVEISRVVPPDGSTTQSIFLLESPEPLPWDRIYFTLGRSASVPLRRRTVVIDRRAFGAPDAGSTFEYGGLRWTTDVELEVTRDGVRPRVSGPWNIVIEAPGATLVQLVVRVDAGGSAQLHGDGVGVSGDVTQGPTGTADAPLAISATELTRVTLTGAGTTIVSLTTFERFRPEVPRGAVRLAQATLPLTASDDHHFVDLTTFADVDISGWTIRWFASNAPGEPALYHVFAPGTVIKDGDFVRVYGSRSAPAPEPGLRVVGGGTIGILPPDGAVFQLSDSSGRLVHEVAILPETSFPSPWAHPESLAISGDGTRAFFVPLFGNHERGHWRLRLQMSRAGYWGGPAFSVGRDTSPEIAVMQFTAE